MSKVEEVIAAASKEIGSPYVFGDEGPDTFDCSGLIQFVFSQVGIRLPRTAAQQQEFTTPVDRPAPGDLVFWGRPATHVGLYIGGGKMIAAPHAGAKVRVQDVYGTPAGYHRVAGLGAGLAAGLGGVVQVANGVGDDIRGWLDGVRYGVLELAAAGAGLALIGYGLWRAVGRTALAQGQELLR